jgi:hypothetical protein
MANLLIAKTNAYLTQEEYQKWHDLYIGMIADGFLMVDGRFTLYSIDKNEKIEELKDNRGNQERY